MSIDSSAESDERTVAVENASYKWAYAFLIFALLIDVIYRGLVRDEAAWDLLALVIVGGAVSTLYQVRQKALTDGRAKTMWRVALVAGVLGAIVGAIIAWSRS